MKKIHLKDIAKDLKLSKTAVSLVLNNKGDENKISKETQKKIIEYAKEHNYVPNQLARGLSRGKSETIGLIVPNISDSFYARIADRIERKANEIGYTVIYSSSYENPKKETELIQAMVNRQVEGIIIASTQKNKKQIESLKQEKFPFVLIDRFYPDCDTDYVMVDNSDGTKKAVEHLLGLGRKKLGFVTLNSELEVMDQRKSGFKNTLQDAGLPFEDNMVQEIDRDDYVQETKSAIETLVSYPSSVDAIVFATHFLAAEGLRQLKKVGIRVPQDVAIISFGELSAFDLVDPPITAIKLPTAAIGNTAFDMLMNRIKTKEPSHHHEKRQLNTSLEIRRSCGTLN